MTRPLTENEIVHEKLDIAVEDPGVDAVLVGMQNPTVIGPTQTFVYFRVSDHFVGSSITYEEFVLTDFQTVIVLSAAPSDVLSVRIQHHRPNSGSFGVMFAGTAGQTPDFTLSGSNLNYQKNSSFPFATGDVLRVAYET